MTLHSEGPWKEAEELGVQVMETKKEGARDKRLRHADQHEQSYIYVKSRRSIREISLMEGCCK